MMYRINYKYDISDYAENNNKHFIYFMRHNDSNSDIDRL